MKKFFFFAAIAATFCISISSCAKKGCTNSNAHNYDHSAKSDDGSCTDLTTAIVGNYVGNLIDYDNLHIGYL